MDLIYTNEIKWLTSFHSEGFLGSYTVENFPRGATRFKCLIVELLQLFVDSGQVKMHDKAKKDWVELTSNYTAGKMVKWVASKKSKTKPEENASDLITVMGNTRNMRSNTRRQRTMDQEGFDHLVDMFLSIE